jgi:rhodanese-related sulfurtransferase
MANRGMEASILQRKIHIDPAELLHLMNNNQVQVVLADVRRQSDYSVFHLLDADNVSLGQLDSDWTARVPREAVVVVMSNDERTAEEAWKRLAVQLNPSPHLPVEDKSRVYILAGGVNRWLDIYRSGKATAPGPEIAPAGDDTCRHRFSTATGSRDPAARPEAKHAPKREFVTKVQAVRPVRSAGGGCG